MEITRHIMMITGPGVMYNTISIILVIGMIRVTGMIMGILMICNMVMEITGMVIEMMDTEIVEMTMMTLEMD